MEAKTPIITVGLSPAIDRVIEVKNLTIGAHQTGREVSRSPGGKALNVTRVIAAMGLDCHVTGFLGEDNDEAFAQLLSAEHVIDRMVRLRGPTRVNITLADPVNSVETHIRTPGLSVGPGAIEQLLAALDELTCPGAMVVLSGSLPPGIDGLGHQRLVDAAAGAGAKVVIDSHGEALEALTGRVEIVSPNREELAGWAGRELADESDIVSAGLAMLDRSAGLLVSLGDAGAIWIDSESQWRASLAGLAIGVVNTVGCGDTLLGAFLAARTVGQDPQQALAWAVATASASAQTLLPGQFDPIQRDRLLEAIQVQQI